MISHPRTWTNEVRLKPKGVVVIMAESDGSLFMVSYKDLRNVQESEVTVKLPEDFGPDLGRRLFIAHYLAEYDVIRL